MRSIPLDCKGSKWRIVRGEKGHHAFSPRVFPIGISETLWEKSLTRELPTGHLAPRWDASPNYFWRVFSPHNLSTLLLSAPKQQKGVRYQVLWICCCPNEHRNVIYDMKYAKNRECKGGTCRTGLGLNRCSNNQFETPSPDPGLAIQSVSTINQSQSLGS